MRCTAKTTCGYICKKNRIPGTDYCTIHNPNYKIENPVCSVCLDLPNDPVKLDSCVHVFCKACISKACCVKPSCPYCREPVTPLDSAKSVYYIHGKSAYEKLKTYYDNYEKIIVPKRYRPQNLPVSSHQIRFDFE
jgi:hypothetical protein